MRFFIIILLLFNILPVQARHLYKESEYKAYWCNQRGGQAEYVLPNKARVDCLLPDMAVEFDFAKKFHECIGQALEYSAWTKKTPACVLIIEKDKDWKYVKRLRYTKQKKYPELRTFTIRQEKLGKYYMQTH